MNNLKLDSMENTSRKEKTEKVWYAYTVFVFFFFQFSSKYLKNKASFRGLRMLNKAL